MYNSVAMTISEGIAEVKLNRPEKLNAIDRAMFEELVEIGDELARTPALRAVIICGEGRSFCVGIDLAQLDPGQRASRPSLVDRTHGDCNLFQAAAMQWRRLPVPVIACVHGHALGGGFQLMLGADIRIIAPDTALCVKEIAWGLVPDMAGFVLLRDIVRADVLRDLVMTGRTFRGSEAAQLGLATRLSDHPIAAGRRLASELAALSPDAMRAAKRLANLAGTGCSADLLLLAEAEEQEVLLASANHAEAVAAGMTRRKPQFGDLSVG